MDGIRDLGNPWREGSEGVGEAEIVERQEVSAGCMCNDGNNCIVQGILGIQKNGELDPEPLPPLCLLC